MIIIDNLDTWTKEYFSLPENQKKAEKACERYDRLMVKNIRRQLNSGMEHINLADLPKEDPGKCFEKVKFETIPSVECEGQKGKLRINLLDQTAEFIVAAQ